jgi:hypothetical protein
LWTHTYADIGARVFGGKTFGMSANSFGLAYLVLGKRRIGGII